MLQKIPELLNFKIAFLALLKAFDSPVAVGLDWICSSFDIGSSALINGIILRNGHNLKVGQNLLTVARYAGDIFGCSD